LTSKNDTVRLGSLKLLKDLYLNFLHIIQELHRFFPESDHAMQNDLDAIYGKMLIKELKAVIKALEPSENSSYNISIVDNFTSASLEERNHIMLYKND
jgi:hypothetical protein